MAECPPTSFSTPVLPKWLRTSSRSSMLWLGAPPPRFSGGGKWEAMHGDMAGYYEVRATGP